jgi:hypothetical protein
MVIDDLSTPIGANHLSLNLAGLEAYHYICRAERNTSTGPGFIPQNILLISLPSCLTRSIMYQVWEGFVDGLVGGLKDEGVSYEIQKGQKKRQNN